MGMVVVGVVVAALLDQLTGSNGIVEGMFDMIKVGVVKIVIPLSAVMMLWLGIMRLAEKSGMIQAVSCFVRPVMKRLFPEVPEDHPAMSAMVMNMAANMLGLGNAATPLGLKAMQHLDELNPNKGTATNSMCTFLAINTSSVTLIPATAIGLLAAQGIAEPYAIVGTTIGATLCSTIVAIIAVKTFERMPVFRRETAAPVVAKEEAVEYEVKPKGISVFGKVILWLVGLLFAGIIFLEMYPDKRIALQEALGLREIAIQLDAEGASLNESEPEKDKPIWQRAVSANSQIASFQTGAAGAERVRALCHRERAADAGGGAQQGYRD